MSARDDEIKSLQGAIKAIEARHATELEEAKSERDSLLLKHASELETAAAALAAAQAAHGVATRELEDKHATDSNVLRDGHATELANLFGEKAAELEALRQQHANELHELKGSHSRAMDEQTQNHSSVVGSLTSSKDAELADLSGQLDSANAEILALQSKNQMTSKSLSQTEANLSTAEETIAELNANLSNIRNELVAARAAADALALANESEITKLRKELSESLESLKFTQGKNDEDDKRHSKERNDLEMELTSTKNEIDELKEKVYVTPSNTCSCS